MKSGMLTHKERDEHFRIVKQLSQLGILLLYMINWCKWIPGLFVENSLPGISTTIREFLLNVKWKLLSAFFFTLFFFKKIITLVWVLTLCCGEHCNNNTRILCQAFIPNNMNNHSETLIS